MRAVRNGAWKAEFETQPSYTMEKPVIHDTPLLYNIENDPSEKYDLAAKYPEIIKELRALYDHQIATVKLAESEINKTLAKTPELQNNK